jgi:hypothetical protein
MTRLQIALMVLAVAAGQIGVWYAYASDANGILWLAVALSVVGPAVIVLAGRAGARLGGKGNGSRPRHSGREPGEDR